MSNTDPKIIQELSVKYGVSTEVSRLALTVSYGNLEEAEEYLEYVIASLAECDSDPVVDQEQQVFILHFSVPVEDKNYPDCHERRVSAIIARDAKEAYDYLIKSYPGCKVPPIEQIRIEPHSITNPGVIYDSDLDDII